MTDGFEITSVENAWCRYCSSMCLKGVNINMEDVRTIFAPYASRTGHFSNAHIRGQSKKKPKFF
jgi:hypothetical protein